MKNILKVYGYIRTANISSDIRTQIEMLHNYASDKNLKLDAIYVDEGINGLIKNKVNTAFEELNQIILNSNGNITVIMRDISRISRDISEVKKTLSEWNKRGVNLILLEKTNMINIPKQVSYANLQ